MTRLGPTSAAKTQPAAPEPALQSGRTVVPDWELQPSESCRTLNPIRNFPLYIDEWQAFEPIILYIAGSPNKNHK